MVDLSQLDLGDPETQAWVRQNVDMSDPETQKFLGPHFASVEKTNQDFIKQMTKGITAPIGRDATGTATAGDGVLGRALGAAKGGAKEAMYGNPIYRKLAESDPGAIADAMAQNPGLSLHDAKTQVQNSVRQRFGKELGQAQAQVDANSQGDHPILNSVIPGVAGAPFDPVTYLPLPGAEIAKPVEKALSPLAGRLAARLAGKGAEALGHGVVQGGAMAGENVVDQGINIHDKLQDKFDPSQVLKSFEGGAIVGAGMHLTVSPFVQKLFGDRGMDTKPAEDPRGERTTPISQPLAPEDQAQYHELLAKGSADDINGFFHGRNGPRPDPVQVDQWVKYRDAVPEGYAQEEYQPQFDLAKEAQKQTVRDHIADVTSTWKNAPDFEVIHHVDEIADPQVREQARSEVTDDALGFVGNDGKVRIFADRVDSPETMNSLIYHEALGHYGLSQKFGTSLDATLKTLMDRNVGKFSTDVDKWIEDHPGEYNGDRVRAAEEVLAEQSQGGQIKPTTWDAVSAQVRRYGRRMGLKLAYSDNEINTILGMAHDAVVNGKGRDVQANGFRFMRKEPREDDQEVIGYHGSPHANIDEFTTEGLRNRTGTPGTVSFTTDPEVAKIYGDNVHRAKVSGKFGDFENPDHIQQVFDWRDKSSLQQSVYKRVEEDALNKGKDPQAAIQDAKDKLRSDIQSGQYSLWENKQMWKDLGWDGAFTNEHGAKNIVVGDSAMANKFMKRSQLNTILESLTDDQRRNVTQHSLDAWGKESDNHWNTLTATQKLVGDHEELIDNYHNALEDPRATKEERDGLWSELFQSLKSDRAGLHKIGGTVGELRDALYAGRDASHAYMSKLLHKMGDADNNRLNLVMAKSPAGLAEHLHPTTETLIDEMYNKGNPNGAKFMKRSQLAASPGHVSDDLEGIYKSLDENYEPDHVTDEEAQRRALSLGFKPSQIRDLGDIGDLKTRLWRMGAAINMADKRISELNDKLGTPDWSMADQASYLKTLADRNYLLTRIKGDKAEIARALNASKAFPSYTSATLETVAEQLRDAGSGLADLADDPLKFMKFAQSIKQLMQSGNPAGAHVKMAGINKPYWEQYLTSFHFNAMLSGLSTHVKAPLDMMTGIAHNVIDHALAWPIGKLRNTFETMTGQTVKSGVTSQEIAGRMYGVLRSAFDHEVYVKTLHAARTGDGSIVMPNGTSMSTSPVGTYVAAGNPRIPFVSIPTDLITAQDTFFRSHAMAQNMYGLANRRAEEQLRNSGKKYTWDDVMALGSSYAHNPDPTLIKEAREAAEKSLLLNKNSMTSWLDKMKQRRPGMTVMERAGAFAAENLAPFIRVSSNSLLTRTIERSPLPLLSPTFYKTLAKGGPEADLAIARMAYGSVKLGLYWMAADAAKDKLTGHGPENPDKKKALEAGGWEPSAVHENGRYNNGSTLAMSLNPFDLHNSTAQMVAGMRQSYEEGMNEGKVGLGLKMALGTIIHDFESESWVGDVSSGFDALTASGTTAGQKVAKFVGDEAKTWVPNILNQTNRVALDPNQKDTGTTDVGDISGQVVNDVKSAIPGLSKQLPTRYSVYGDPMPTGASVTGVHTWVTKGNGRPETTDPTKVELQRLEKLVPSAIVTPVQKTVHISGVPLRLNPQQFEEYQMYAGQSIVETVRQEMQDPKWQGMSDQDKIAEVRDIEHTAKDQIRKALLEKDGWLTEDQLSSLRKQLNGK